MTLGRTLSVGLAGVEGRLVDVEVDIARGVPGFSLVGLPDAALNEARDRIRAALTNSGYSWPNHRITVSLSPASEHKRGSGFDLAIAVAMLAALGKVDPWQAQDLVVMGEVGLDGSIRPVRGVLPSVLAAVSNDRRHVVVPARNGPEAAAVPGAVVCPVSSLGELVQVLTHELPVPDVAVALDEGAEPVVPDLSDVLGQPLARRVVEVAAAGGHHLLLHGAPGVGKSLLAERLPGLLPPLDDDAAMQVAAVRSIVGALPPGSLDRRPPFQAPHHSASVAALVGGGSGVPRPGAISLAHRGVLLLDEAPEFARNVLDALRQPLESGVISIGRAKGSFVFPSRVQLVMTANPCPCGMAVGKGLGCTCTPTARRSYMRRMSGPLLDRVDLRLQMDRPSRADLEARSGESTATVAARVAASRERARRRLESTVWTTNADVPASWLREHAPLHPDLDRRLMDEMHRHVLTMRGVERVLRVAWTIADLAGADQPDDGHVAEAKAYRAPVAAVAA